MSMISQRVFESDRIRILRPRLIIHDSAVRNQRKRLRRELL